MIGHRLGLRTPAPAAWSGHIPPTGTTIPTALNAVVRRATERARQLTDAPPFAAAFAPGRVNLIGEHTDYSGGFVLPIAIDRVCVAVAAASRDDRVRFAFDDHPMVLDVDPRETQEPRLAAERGTPAAYVRGVVRAFQDEGASIPPMLIAVASSVPLGSGLSSSASLEVSVATLLARTTGLNIPPADLAAMGRRAEHEFAGVPCGIMDQTISALGQRGHAMLLDCRSGLPRFVPMPDPADAVVAVINTNVRHALSDGEYAQRRDWCESAASALGVRTLRDLSDPPGRTRLERERTRLSPDQYRAARHVVGENLRTVEAAAALSRHDTAAFGALMLESHASLRDDYRVSCPELDLVVDTAANTPGVYGARMTGAGFGGCAIALCHPDAVPSLAKRLNDRYPAAFGLRHDLFTTTASPGAGPAELP
jgi:galactokinase